MGKYAIQLSAIVALTTQGRGVHAAVEEAKTILRETFAAKGIRLVTTFAPHVVCLEPAGEVPLTFAFGEALRYIEEGKPVSRLVWAGARGHVTWEHGALVRKQGRFTIDAWWSPGQDDCLAKDWYLYGSQEGELVELHNNHTESACVTN